MLWFRRRSVIIPAMQQNQRILEAIALQKCIKANYNRTTIKIAPHIMYKRHDALFVDAVTLEREGQPPREIKLGSFKLDGLRDLELVGHTFQPASLFNPADPKYEGGTVFAVEV